MPTLRRLFSRMVPAKGSVLTRVLMAAVLMALLFAGTVVGSRPSAAEELVPEAQLNLSHIACVETDVAEVHFVVVNLPDGITPGELRFTGIVGGAPGDPAGNYTIPTYSSETGNVFHYSYFGGSGYYEIQSGEVDLSDGSILPLHNPYEYSGDYDCGMGGCHPVAGQDSWSFTFSHPLTAQATITVKAMRNGRWRTVATATVEITDAAQTIVTGGYTLPMPPEATSVRFQIDYLGKVRTTNTIKPASG